MEGKTHETTVIVHAFLVPSSATAQHCSPAFEFAPSYLDLLTNP